MAGRSGQGYFPRWNAALGASGSALRQRRLLFCGSCCGHYCSTQIERFTLDHVKRVMNRMRLLLGAMLPALWLLATGHCCLGSTTDFAGQRCGASTIAPHDGQRLPSPCSCSFEQLARTASRRAWVNSGFGGPPLLVASDSAFLDCLPNEGSLRVCRFSAGLDNSWQFHWRTALDPRAPSSVS